MAVVTSGSDLARVEDARIRLMVKTSNQEIQYRGGLGTPLKLWAKHATKGQYVELQVNPGLLPFQGYHSSEVTATPRLPFPGYHNSQITSIPMR